MARHTVISSEVTDTFVSSHAEWKRSEGSLTSLTRTFTFEDYPSSIAFAVRVAFAAEKRNHHPDMHIQWAQVRVEWWTHDTGDITDLDLEMAQVIDRIYASG